MKAIRPNDKTRSFTGLYQDSQCQSTYHEKQKFGLRANEKEEESEGAMEGKTVERATF